MITCHGDQAPAAAVQAAGSPRATSLCGELARLLERRAATDGMHPTGIPELTFWRYSEPTAPIPVIMQPAVYVVVQGRKNVAVGDDLYVYDSSRYLAVSLELPAVANIAEASPDAPYLCMSVQVDSRELAGLIVEMGRPSPRSDHGGRAIFVSPLESPFLDALLRLVRLLDAPQDLPVLGPMLRRELHFRLLQGDQGERLAEMAIGDGRLRRMAGAIAWIKEHFTEALEVEALADRVAMSASTFHSHFKAVTAMSPIQYQKHLRLQEARRLLLTEAASAEVVAYQVGYASPSQFSREYARLFGEPPRRDAERMRESRHVLAEG